MRGVRLRAQLTVFSLLFAAGMWMSKVAQPLHFENADAMAALQVQKQSADLRLGVLQAQVEPHFLFNTLASVRALRTDGARRQPTDPRRLP